MNNDRDELISRRAFLAGAVAAATATSLLYRSSSSDADPPEVGDPILADKHLDLRWVESLTAPGVPKIYSGASLSTIGMPVGGLCAGQLYLGGDGKLWRWDIFNHLFQSKGEGQWYLKYPDRDFPIDQGFLLRIDSDANSQPRNLDTTGFSKVTFRGEYPMGFVDYSDPSCPVAVRLKAFSPFIPLDFDRSSYPATIFRYTLKNTSSGEVTATIAGWMQNGVRLSDKSGSISRLNSIVDTLTGTALSCELDPSSINTDNPKIDDGTMMLALLGCRASESSTSGGAATLKAGINNVLTASGTSPLIGSIARTVTLKPGETASVDFAIAWHFPHLHLDGLGDVGNYYGSKHGSALDVVKAIESEFDMLVETTDLWRTTWYDSTLPRWFLDRTFANTSTLATATSRRFANGRFYGWEGVGLGVGTCTHVWHYAQAVARLFPELERDTRQRVDLGIALVPETGVIKYRAEFDDRLAIDGQTGTILRFFREHQMTANNVFLSANWEKIKITFNPLFNLDPKLEGILQGPQLNTLDFDWYGQISWLSSLYVAALRAGEAMAAEMGDTDFENKCRTVAENGTKNITDRLFNSEYYYNIIDPDHPHSLNSGTGCEIDQVHGQAWALKVGLPRVLPKRQTVTALRSLYRYNFTPDVGPYRQVYPQGRWYATDGEGGLIIATFPRPDWTFKQAIGSDSEYAAGYFNECQGGYEHNAASHMISEGLVLEGLAVERAIHDRYDAAKRNPYNEIEYGDHYARSMASYGVFLAACGYQYHGPKGDLTFAPAINPHNAKFAFTTAEGWGSYAQRFEDNKLYAAITVKYGKLKLKTLTLTPPDAAAVKHVTVTLTGKPVRASHTIIENRIAVAFREAILIETGQTLHINMA